MTIPAVITTPRATVIIDFLTSIGWDTSQETGYPLYPGPEILTSPDQAVFITPAGGPGYATEEGSADAWAFQARVRGPSDDPAAAARAAQLLDWTVLHAATPAAAAGVAVLAAYRMSSPPAPLPLDPADRRTEYTATYVLVTGG